MRLISPILDGGPACETNVGAIILANDLVSERELREFLPVSGVNLYATRVPCDIEGGIEALQSMGPHLSSATRLLAPAERLDAVVFSCTSGSAAIGAPTIEKAIHDARPGCAVVTPLTASVEALRFLGVSRVAVLTPYDLSVHAMMLKFYENEGFAVVDNATFGSGREDIVRRISPQSILKEAAALDHADAQAIFISCTTFRCAEMIVDLERLCGKPVVTSNQASAWAALKAAGSTLFRPNRGRLLEKVS
jgi:maleate isomerase